MTSEREVQKIIASHLDGSISRRQFIGRLAAAGVALTAIPAIVAACANASPTAAPSAAAGASAAAGGGKAFRLFETPKWTGFPAFEGYRAGGELAAKELGDIFTYGGADHSDPLLQSQTITNFIAQKPDAILLASIDLETSAPVLKQALAQGIKVVTYDADIQTDARNVFVNQVSYVGAAKLILDTLLLDDPSGGPVAFVAATPNTANHMHHIEEAKKLMATDPKYKVFTSPYETAFANDDDAKSYDVAVNLMQAHPEMKYIGSSSAASCPAAARAIVATGKAGKVYSGGFALPSAIKKYLKDGSHKAFGLWDVNDMGYLTAYVAHYLLSGDLKIESGSLYPAAGAKVTAGKSGDYVVGDKGELIYGKPLIFTADNVDKYNF